MKLREWFELNYRSADMKSGRGKRPPFGGPRNPRWIVAILIVVSVLGTPESRSEVVLLKNGNTLAGTVRKDRGRWQVELEAGGLVTVPRDTVDFVGPDLPSAYRHLRRRITGREASPLARVVSWGLQHRLLNETAPDLVQLRQLDDHRGTWNHLERRWAELSQMSSSPAETSGGGTAVVLAAWNEVDPADSPDGPAGVASTGLTTDRGLTTERAPISHPALAAEQGELFRADELKAFSKEAYPLLIARCSGAGCHSDGPANADRRFRLLDRHWGITAIRRSAASTYEFLDWEQPLESPLLQYARRPHGSRREAPLPAHERRSWVKLEAWVQAASEAHQRAAATSSGGSWSADAAAAHDEASFRSPQPPQPLDPLDPAAFNRLSAPEPVGEPVAEPVSDASQPPPTDVPGADE